MTLSYRGQGRFLVGVPARDLSADEIRKLPERLRARLIPSGLYAPKKTSGGKER